MFRSFLLVALFLIVFFGFTPSAEAGIFRNRQSACASATAASACGASQASACGAAKASRCGPVRRLLRRC